MRPTALQAADVTGRPSVALPTTFCWQLAGERGPSVHLALHVGESLRAAVMQAGNRIGMARLPDSFHSGASDGAHDHAWWLSEDRDGDGLIDHVTVHARSALAPELVAALAGTRTVHLGARDVVELVPVSLGRPRSGGLLGPAQRWIAATAYVTPKHRTDPEGAQRPHLTPEAPLREEMARRGLPAPLSVIWREAVAARDKVTPTERFVTLGRGRRAPVDAWRGAPELTFADPVAGPLAFGFGAHFGLGLLVPAPTAGITATSRHPAALARRKNGFPGDGSYTCCHQPAGQGARPLNADRAREQGEASSRNQSASRRS